MGTIATQPLWLRVAVFRVSQSIGDLHGLALKKNSAGEAGSPRPNLKVLVIFNVFAREAVTCRDTMSCVSRRVANLGDNSLAKAGGGLYHRVQRGLEIESRTTDDLEHICSGGLLLQGFGQVVRPRLHLLEQPNIVDRYDDLVGKCLDELYLSFREWLKVCVSNRDNANDPAALF
jgi:hypothetical protein